MQKRNMIDTLRGEFLNAGGTKFILQLFPRCLSPDLPEIFSLKSLNT